MLQQCLLYKVGIWKNLEILTFDTMDNFLVGLNLLKNTGLFILLWKKNGQF